MIKKFFLILSIITTSIVICACGCGSTKETNTETQTTTIFEAEQTTEVPTSDVVSSENNESEPNSESETNNEGNSFLDNTDELYVRNTDLENVIFDHFKSDTTNLIKYSNAQNCYLYFTPEQISAFDNLCEQYVNGEITYSLELEMNQQVIIAEDGSSYKGIKGGKIDVLKFSFDGMTITPEEFERKVRNECLRLLEPDYLFIRIYYDRECDVSNAYFVIATGQFM